METNGGAGMAMGMSAESLLRVLEALYQTTDRDTRRQANDWLEQFQQSIDAWQISDRLLHDANSSMEVRYFCAQTLRTKVQRDFEELPPGSAASLRSSLLELLLAHKNGPSAVRTQLCLALASLAAHTPASDWTHPPAQGEGAGVVSWLQHQLGTQPDAVPALLEVLTVLVQEVGAYKLAVKPERRRQFSAELVTSAAQVFGLLAACYASAPSNVNLANAVLQTFGAWLRFSTGVAAGLILASPLLTATLEGLKSPDTFEAAVEACCELIRFTIAEGPAALAANMALVQVLVPRIMELRPRFAAAAKAAAEAAKEGGDAIECDDDDDTVKDMARLFAEMGEAYVDLIASGSSESMMITEALLEVTAHPDSEIASTTFNFWHLLSTHLAARPRHVEGGDLASDAVAAVEHERRLAAFKGTFEVLVSLVTFRVRYPADYDAMRKDERADFKQMRYAVADVLNDVLRVLGPDRTVQLLAEPLFQGAAAAGLGGLASASAPAGVRVEWDWASAEASLYCIRAVAGPDLSHDQRVLPQVMALLPSLPQHPLLLYTASLTIAAYCEWLAAAPSAPALLPQLLTLLTTALSVPGDAPAAAALALKHVCDACRQHLLGSVQPLLQLYTQVLTAADAHANTNANASAGAMGGNGGDADASKLGTDGYSLETEDELQIIEGLSVVVSCLPADQCGGAVNALCTPIVTQLERVVAAAQSLPPNAQPSSSKYVVHIDRLANIFRFVSQPSCVADAFRRVWPLFKTIFSQRANDTRVMERLCRACKFAIRTGKQAIAPVLGPLLEEVQAKFEQHQQSCLLYVASEVIKVFGKDTSCAPYLHPLITVLFAQTTKLLRRPQDFTSHPDIADDCFLLASRCMRYCGQLVIPTPTFPALLDCAMTGMLVQHREACKSILSFLRDSLELVLVHVAPSSASSPSIQSSVNGMSAADMRRVAETVVAPRGPVLCQLLMAAFTGALPESRNDDVMDLLYSLLRGCGPISVQWVQGLLAAIPQQALSDNEKTTFLHAASAAASDTPSSANAAGNSGHGSAGAGAATTGAGGGAGPSAEDSVREQLLSAIDELSGSCRRNKRVLHAVQSTLIPPSLAPART